MPGPATTSDLQARSFRTLTSQELTVGGTLLEDAYSIVLARVPSVGDRVSDTAFRALVVQVQCSMVLRVLRNPDGKLEESIDDYRYRLDQAVSTGALYISDDEAKLLGVGDGASDGAFTITPGRVAGVTGWWTAPDVWTPGA